MNRGALQLRPPEVVLPREQVSLVQGPVPLLMRAGPSPSVPSVHLTGIVELLCGRYCSDHLVISQ